MEEQSFQELYKKFTEDLRGKFENSDFDFNNTKELLKSLAIFFNNNKHLDCSQNIINESTVNQNEDNE